MTEWELDRRVRQILPGQSVIVMLFALIEFISRHEPICQKRTGLRVAGHRGLGFRVCALGFGVRDYGFRGLKVWGLGC